MPGSESQKENFGEAVVCPVCDSTGRKESGFVCSNCQGSGIGYFFHGRFFYWEPKLGKTVIELGHFRKKFSLIINMLSLILGVVGLLSLSWWVYQGSTIYKHLGAFAFWQVRDVSILVFWVGLAAGMFAYYRLSVEEQQRHKIKNISYDDKSRKQVLPKNWAEIKALPAEYRIDVSGGYTDQAFDVVERAYLLADKLDHGEIEPLHLFYSSLSEIQVAAVFSRLNVDSRRLIAMLKKHIESIPKSENQTRLSRSAKEILVSAYLDANRLGQKKVTAKNLIIPAIGKSRVLKDILYELEVDENKVFNVILWFIINEKQIASYQRYKRMARFKPSKNMDRAYTSVATPALNQLGYDLTIAAKWGMLDYCVAREKEISNIWQQLESGVSGIMLVGPPGVGKNTVIDGIAQLMVREDVPRFLQDKRLVELDAARLISGASPAEAQGRLLEVLDEIVRAGNIALYINNIENLIGITSGGEESLDLSGVLASAMDRKAVYVFGSATPDNYVKYIEGSALGDSMARVEVPEPRGNQAIQIIESKIGHLEGKYKVYFAYDAILEVINLSNKYIHDKYLPEKAVKILELVAVKVAKERGEHELVSKNDIAAIVSELTKIPLTKVGESEGRQLLDLEKNIHSRMINQNEAVKMVAASLRRARTELREEVRPIASFLFLGPTGVGKTELAKTVSEVYFGNEKYMIRVDMSEYQHPDSIKKLIGDARSTKGYLTEAVRQQPFALTLLDEIEKAHPEILNVFLQVMDDGRLTDGQGRTIDFTNTIIIATSNIGAKYIQEQIFAGAPTAKIKDELINTHLKDVMRPELINRFDGIIVFEPLSMENVVDVTRLMLNKISSLLEAKGVALEVNETGLRILAKEGFDPKFGARPLRRLLQEKIEDIIANRILSGDLKRRDTVVIDEAADIQIRKGKFL